MQLFMFSIRAAEPRPAVWRLVCKSQYSHHLHHQSTRSAQASGPQWISHSDKSISFQNRVQLHHLTSLYEMEEGGGREEVEKEEEEDEKKRKSL